MSSPEPARVRELRVALTTVAAVEVRDATGTGDGSWTIEGNAAVFDSTTTLYDGAGMRVLESIAPGAFTQVLAESPTVHLNFGHDMNTSVASTLAPGKIGRLELTETPSGLHFFARVDPADPDAQRLAVKLRSGVVNQASFAFRIGDEQLTETTDPDTGKVTAHYRILRVSALFDVCCCAQGAYSDTTSFIRTHPGVDQGRLTTVGGHEDRTTLVGPDGITTEGADATPPPDTELDVARARARARAAARMRKEKTYANPR